MAFVNDWRSRADDELNEILDQATELRNKLNRNDGDTDESREKIMDGVNSLQNKVEDVGNKIRQGLDDIF